VLVVLVVVVVLLVGNGETEFGFDEEEGCVGD